MESQPESTEFSEWARSVEPWVWPAIAAVVVSGLLLLSTIIGMCWLAARPARQPIVIWMPSAIEQRVDHEHATATHATVALENRFDARTN
jgi:ABC-type phosphate transport system auxiliary subunit